MIPLISEEMVSHGWMTVSEVSDIVAIAEMTPGPLGLNCATFAGLKNAGILGAFVAASGVLTPALSLTALAAVFFERFKNSTVMTKAMTGVRPACVGMIFGVLLSLSMSNYAAEGAINLSSILIGIADAVLLFRFKASIPLTILLSAAAGLLCYVL